MNCVARSTNRCAAFRTKLGQKKGFLIWEDYLLIGLRFVALNGFSRNWKIGSFLTLSVDATLSDVPHHAADMVAHWNLEYSSDTSAHMDHVLDAAALGGYPGDLALAPPPGFNTAQMGPIIPTAPGGVADLSGACRIVGTSSTDMTVIVDYNPLKLSESAITGVTFTTNANSGVTITAPGSGTTDSSTWKIEGPVDGVNAILATMQASISSTATAPGHFMVSVTDADYADAATRTNSAFVVQNFYIPVTDQYQYVAEQPGSSDSARRN